jgi:hypothetical protein
MRNARCGAAIKSTFALVHCGHLTSSNLWFVIDVNAVYLVPMPSAAQKRLLLVCRAAGHYVSLIKSKSTWLFFDDDQVDLISESTVAATFGSTQVRETAEWQLQRVISQQLLCTR